MKLAIKTPRIFLCCAFWVLLTACGGGSSAVISSMAPVVDRTSAGNRWSSLGLHAYRFTLRTSCFCFPEEDIVIAVQSGAMVSATYTPSGQAVPASRVATLAATSVDALFTLIDQAAARPVAVLNATYHPSLGYPQSVYIDAVSNIADDEFSYTVVDFSVL